MVNKILKKSILFLLILSPFYQTSAFNNLDVVINEIAWMGTKVSYNDEWIELYNNTNNPVNFDNWILKAVDGKPEIILSGTIQANGFFLLERANDNSVLNITADQIYTGALSNNGEHLQLFDNQNNLIDEVNQANSWLTGDNKTKQTMERTNPALSIWKTSKNPEGTPRSKNSVFTKQESDPEPIPEPEQVIEQEVEQRVEQQVEEKTYAVGIIFSEILPSPEGPDTKNEWIEIFNKNDFNVDLSGWKIKDSVGSITTYTFPKKIIEAQSYLVLLRPGTKITLNNDADILNLIQPNGIVTDTVSYEKAPRNQSFNLTNSGWSWSEKLTPEAPNIIKQTQEQGFKKLILKSPDNKAEKNDIMKDDENMLATVGKQISEPNESSNVYLIALILALFSGIVILIFKKTIKKNRLIFKEK